MSSTAPAWVVIDSSTGVLNVTAPIVSADTEFDFYIDSTIAGVSQPIKKLIKIIILDCKAANWSKCKNTNSSVWEVWNSGYALSSGSWTLQRTNVTTNIPTDIAKNLSISTAFVGAAVILLSALVGAINSSSIVTLWTTIHQLQIFKVVLF